MRIVELLAREIDGKHAVQQSTSEQRLEKPCSAAPQPDVQDRRDVKQVTALRQEDLRIDLDVFDEPSVEPRGRGALALNIALPFGMASNEGLYKLRVADQMPRIQVILTPLLTGLQLCSTELCARITPRCRDGDPLVANSVVVGPSEHRLQARDLRFRLG